MCKYSNGFSLLEVVLCLSLIGLVLNGLFQYLPRYLQQQRSRSTQQQLVQARQALLDFAISHGRLPCPASEQSHGHEVFRLVAPPPAAGGSCQHPFKGLFPAATLGVENIHTNGLWHDAWGSPIRYAVTPMHNTVAVDAFTQTNEQAHSFKGMSIQQISRALKPVAGQWFPGIHICPWRDVAAKRNEYCQAKHQLSNQVVALVWSTGQFSGARGEDEQQNLADDRFFIFHEPRDPGGLGGAFDDQLMWIALSSLLGDVVRAGRLP